MPTDAYKEVEGFIWETLRNVVSKREREDNPLDYDDIPSRF